MNKEFCVLFDMDGVVIDTEPQYDVIWKSIGLKYRPDIPDFEKIIKGTVMSGILSTYFQHLSEEEKKGIEKMVEDYELSMDFYEIKGAIGFIQSLKKAGIKTGLVTSSGEEKVKLVAGKLHFDQLFDTLVSAGRITEGKPHPMCYLLAAKDLVFSPQDCFVFEDSFAGIQSGLSAGMNVIALSTTNPKEKLQDKVIHVLPDFSGFTLENLVALRK